MDGKRKRISSSQSSNGRPRKTRRRSQRAVLRCFLDAVHDNDGMTGGDFTLRLALSEDELTADDRRVIVMALKGSRVVCGALEGRLGDAKAKGYTRSAAAHLIGPLVQRLPAVAEGQVLPEGTVLFLPTGARPKYYVLEGTVCTKAHVWAAARVFGRVTERVDAFTFALCDGTCEGEPKRFCDCESESDCDCGEGGEATCGCDIAGETTCECKVTVVRFEESSSSRSSSSRSSSIIPATGEADSASESSSDSESD